MQKKRVRDACYSRFRRERQAKARLKELTKLKEEVRVLRAAAREREMEGHLRFNPLVFETQGHPAGSPGMPMTIWSDWHWGETVDRRETGGLNEFNRGIAEERVCRLVERTLNILNNYGGAVPDYPGLWVLLGGDMVSGLIHDELIETNWGNIVEQAVEVSGAISGALSNLVAVFGRVWVVGVCGNHGRTTAKLRAKGKALDSYDRAVYKSIERYFKGDERFTFIIPDNTDYLFEVYGHRFLLTHGDSLGTHGGDGIIGALGPIIRGATKLHRAEGQIGRDFDTVVMGHWHQYIPRGDVGVLVNGCLKGYDEYARIFLRAPFARPTQALWIVSPQHGIAAQWGIHLD